MKRILLAEDRPIVVKAMEILLETEFKDCKLDIVGNAEMLEKFLKDQPYALAIISPRILHNNMIHSLFNIRKRYPKLGIVVFSSHINNIYESYFRQNGFKGCIHEDSSDSEIVHALKTVFNGNVYFDTKEEIYYHPDRFMPAFVLF